MNHGQNLRDLLEPLGVYRWEGSFQWGELQSEGAALDGVADALASLQQEMNLTTAQGEGLNRVLELLGRERDREDPESLRETLAALLRIGNGAFTLAAMNDALRGCGIPAVVEETETKQVVSVSFPGVVGVPEDFARRKERVEAILPCHLQVEYRFAETACGCLCRAIKIFSELGVIGTQGLLEKRKKSNQKEVCRCHR